VPAHPIFPALVAEKFIRHIKHKSLQIAAIKPLVAKVPALMMNYQSIYHMSF
jgi:hypothetical protein